MRPDYGVSFLTSLLIIMLAVLIIRLVLGRESKSFTYILDWVWDFGIKACPRTFLPIFSTILIVACSTLFHSKPKSLEDDSSEIDNYEAGSADKSTTKNTSFDSEISKYKLPKPPTTRFDDIEMLLIKNRTPDKQNLALCKSEIESIADEVLNTGDLSLQRKKISYEISANPAFYHWCFYNSMFLLENALQTDSLAVDLRLKASSYFRSIKGLWLLADGLGYAVGSNVYMHQLQSKYMELSHDYFGRELEISHPFDAESTEAPPVSLKKAGPAPVQ